MRRRSQNKAARRCTTSSGAALIARGLAPVTVTGAFNAFRRLLDLAVDAGGAARHRRSLTTSRRPVGVGSSRGRPARKSGTPSRCTRCAATSSTNAACTSAGPAAAGRKPVMTAPPAPARAPCRVRHRSCARSGTALSAMPPRSPSPAAAASRTTLPSPAPDNLLPHQRRNREKQRGRATAPSDPVLDVHLLVCNHQS